MKIEDMSTNEMFNYVNKTIEATKNSKENIKIDIESNEKKHKLNLTFIGVTSGIAALGVTGAVLCTKSLIGQINDQSVVTIGKVAKLILTGGGLLLSSKYALKGTLTGLKIAAEDKEEREELKDLRDRLSTAKTRDELLKENNIEKIKVK